MSPATQVAMQINEIYSLTKPDSLSSRITRQQRVKMFQAFLNTMAPMPDQTVLDVGATSDQSYDHSNYFEAWYPYPERVTAVGIDDASFLETAFPGVRFVRADGRSLPFPDGSFDFVHSNAVLEHVGSASQQSVFMKEMWRVARRGIFLTTPNRWFPVEFHTVLPLLHWLPPSLFRAVLRWLGHHDFAREENLNLLTGSNLKKLTAGSLKNSTLRHVSLFGWPTNLLLIAKKDSADMGKVPT
jgi:ubiquinone/menaquinone biosynthesis C-methylase UbiE